MELNQLKCFLEVARLEHITQAADQLHITQPALSKVIARLEDDLGVKLFDREGKNIRLNEYGRVAQNYAQRIMYTIGDMEAELAEMSAGQAGNLRIGSSFPAQEPNWILECIRTFALQRPDVGVRLRQYSAARLRSALEEREIDLALSTIPIRGGGGVAGAVRGEDGDHPVGSPSSGCPEGAVPGGPEPGAVLLQQRQLGRAGADLCVL